MRSNDDHFPSTPPKLPIRSQSILRADSPSDSAKPDDAAVSDVYREVHSTGSLELAAIKLQQYAQKRPVWMDDPEEQDYQQQYEEDVFEEDETDMDPDEDRNGVKEVVHMQEILPGLWVGDLVAAMDTAGLEEKGISNILSLLRPALKFPEQFATYPLEIDDSADTDILAHLPSCVSWINSALVKRQQFQDPDGEAVPPLPAVVVDKRAQETKPGGVLVHCQAGMSRSATVTAAYLMRTLELDPTDAIEMVREHRPVVDPSETFRYQLGLYYNADGRVSLKDRSTRQFYMERTTSQFMNGDGGAPPMDKMAKYPATPTPSAPATPMGGHGRRKIRCKMCRRHLAVREHMMDHILDQSPVSRPRTPSNFALPSPRMSFSNGVRRPSVVSEILNPLTGLPGATTRSRRGSSSSGIATPQIALTPMITSPLGMSDTSRDNSKESRPSGSGSSKDGQVLSPGIPFPRTTTPGLAFTAASPENANGSGKLLGEPFPANPTLASPKSISRTDAHRRQSSGDRFRSADELASRLPPHLQALRMANSSPLPSPMASSPTSPEKDNSSSYANSQTFPPASGTGVSRKKSLLAMTPSTSGFSERRASVQSEVGGAGSGPPILVNPKCSGYFVEPLTWMEPVLRNGDISGKLVCPNEKCGAKIGNFDWAGVQCGCKEWVTPGFCISRSKVDEVW